MFGFFKKDKKELVEENPIDRDKRDEFYDIAGWILKRIKEEVEDHEKRYHKDQIQK